VEPERERAPKDDVHLLLLLVAMDAPALPRFERQDVQPEARDAELAPERREALVAPEVDPRLRHSLGPWRLEV
jgi:hypothetical protein